MVGGTWIEHVTSSVSRKRSPTELTARGGFDSQLRLMPLPRDTFDKSFTRVIKLRVLLARHKEALVNNLILLTSTTPQVGVGSTCFGLSEGMA